MNRSNAICYRLLGLSGGESIDQIRSAYRNLARRYHPDRVGGDGEQFKEITAAYNQLVQCVSDRASCRTTAPNSPRRQRRRRGDARPGQGKKSRERPWRPEAGSQDQEKVERADWSTFEKTYREHMKNRRQRAAAQSESSVSASAKDRTVFETTPNSNSESDAFAPHTTRNESAPSSRRQAAQPKGNVSDRRKKTSTPPTSEMDSDFAAAWEAWCENARRFDARHGWRDVTTDTPQSDESDSAATTESDPNNGWRQWFRRGMDKLKSRESKKSRGQDVHLRLPVDLRDLVSGGRQKLAIRRLAKCPSCMGRAVASCACDGVGRIEIKEELVVEIPAGAGFGSRIRIRGKGTDGLGTHADGDLHLELEPKDMPGFTRDGLDLHGSCLIPAVIARNGGSVVVELPRGRVKVKVPERTCMGDRFRLRGQGLPKGKTGILGDAYLTVKVEEK